jgi:hypothetical protein
MGVSVTGASGNSVARLTTLFSVLGVLGTVGFYLYGPAVTPALHGAAMAECNELVGGNYRSYHLEWVVDTRPHWLCSNRFKPAQDPIEMGWWVTPGLF